jgi:redox-sensing transcriptional repressor
MGHLGKAISSFFTGRRPKLSIVALFDTDPEKVNRVVHGSRVYPMEQLEALIAERDIGIGIVAVPGSAAQDVADRLVRAGVRGILNFAPARLRVPPNVYVEDLDITVSLETVALFARQGRRRNGIRDDAKRKEASR